MGRARQFFDNVSCVKVVQGFYFPQFAHNTQLSCVQADGMSRCARHRFHVEALGWGWRNLKKNKGLAQKTVAMS